MRSRFPALFAVSAPTIGFLTVGLSGFVLLAAGPRLLGTAQYALLAVAWTIANVIGIGLAQPGEQAVSRATAMRAPGTVRRRVRNRLLLVTGGVCVLPAAGLIGWDPVLGGSQMWAWSIVISSFAWAIAAPRRGHLAGQGQFSAYAVSLGAEAASRIGLVALAWLLPSAADPLLAAAIGVPLLLSALVARILTRPLDAAQSTTAEPLGGRTSNSDQFWYTAVAFSIQLSLALPALILQADDPSSGTAGIFVTASVYMRIPIIFIGGLSVVVLSQVATYFGSGKHTLAATVARKAFVASLLLGALGVLTLWLFSDWALLLLYGENLELPPWVLLILGGSTVAAMAAGVLTQALFGCAYAKPAAAVWIGTAVLVGGIALVVPSTPTSMAATLFGGQGLALCAIAVLALIAFRDSATKDEGAES